eukprot:4227494-Pleurochrysis_carterae.AAC.1
MVYSEQGSLWCANPAIKARPASNLASKARSAQANEAHLAPASKACKAEVWPGPPLNLLDIISITDSKVG